MRLRTWLATAAATTVAFLGCAAQAYPDKPISMIVAYGPGGGTDLTARVIGPFIEKHLGGGAKIVVVNRPGAGGEIGFTALADAAPDGYTIGFINTPNVLSIPIERKTGYSWERFELLGNIVDDPGGFSVHNAGEIKTLADLVTYAKANPNTVTVGTTGVGSDDHLAMLAFQKITGVKMTHVPFPGSSAVRTALVGRHITVGSHQHRRGDAIRAERQPIPQSRPDERDTQRHRTRRSNLQGTGLRDGVRLASRHRRSQGRPSGNPRPPRRSCCKGDS